MKGVQKWRNVNWHTHSLTQTEKTSTYELFKLWFLLQCATAVVQNKSNTLQLCLALGTHRSSCLYRAEELVTHLSQLVSSLMPLKYFSEGEVHRECNTCCKWDPLLWVLFAHALLAASSFTLTPPSVANSNPYCDGRWVPMTVFWWWRVL